MYSVKNLWVNRYFASRLILNLLWGLSGLSCPFSFVFVELNLNLLISLAKIEKSKIENHYFSLIAAPIKFGMF